MFTSIHDVREKKSYKNYESERKDVQEYLRINRIYPSRETILKFIKSRIDRFPLEIYGPEDRVFKFYTDEIHAICEGIFYSILDVDKMREYGNLVNLIGGMRAMQKVYYIMHFASLFSVSNNSIVRGTPYSIQDSWNGIGNWLA